MGIEKDVTLRNHRRLDFWIFETGLTGQTWIRMVQKLVPSEPSLVRIRFKQTFSENAVGAHISVSCAVIVAYWLGRSCCQDKKPSMERNFGTCNDLGKLNQFTTYNKILHI